MICFVPRILIGVVTGLTFQALKHTKNRLLSYGLSGILGSLTNTLLVLGGIYFFFGQDYATAIGSAYNLLLGLIVLTILTSGIPEAILGGFAAYAIGAPLNKVLSNADRS